MKKQSPFKPILNNNKDPLGDFFVKESEKSRQEILSEQQALVDDDFKPSIKEEEKVQTESRKYDVKIGQNDILVTQENWSKLIATLYVDVFNAEKSFSDTSESIVNILSKGGIDVNIDDLKNKFDFINDRMLSIYMAKSVAQGLSLHSEWPAILERELDLHYGSNSRKKAPTEGN